MNCVRSRKINANQGKYIHPGKINLGVGRYEKHQRKQMEMHTCMPKYNSDISTGTNNIIIKSYEHMLYLRIVNISLHDIIHFKEETRTDFSISTRRKAVQNFQLNQFILNCMFLCQWSLTVTAVPCGWADNVPSHLLPSGTLTLSKLYCTIT